MENVFHINLSSSLGMVSKSPERSPVDSIFRGHIKSIGYKTQVAGIDDLKRKNAAENRLFCRKMNTLNN